MNCDFKEKEELKVHRGIPAFPGKRHSTPAKQPSISYLVTFRSKIFQPLSKTSLDMRQRHLLR